MERPSLIRSLLPEFDIQGDHESRPDKFDERVGVVVIWRSFNQSVHIKLLDFIQRKRETAEVHRL